MIIEIVNKKHRAYSTDDPTYVYIGRPSPLGNPFVIGRDGTRDEVIAKYSRWLYYTAQSETHVGAHVRNTLDAILFLAKTNEVIRLVCWCAPLSCHGDVISMWLRKNEDV